jgi:signal transduction histidine kinase
VRWLATLSGPVEVRRPDDLPENTIFRKVFVDSQMASCLVLPLRRGGRLMGTLASLARERRAYHVEEVNAFRLLASVAASALEADLLRAENEAQRARLGAIIDALPVPVAVIDAAGRYEHVNAAVRASFQVSLRIGDPWHAVLDQIELALPNGAPLELPQISIGAALRSEEPVPHEIRVRVKTGWRSFVTHSVALRDEEGRTSGVVAVAQDVTALRELADSRDRFLRVATHELSNPLTSLQGLVNRMVLDEAALADPARRADYVARLRRQVDRMTRLTHDLQDMQRLREGTLRLEREQFDLSELAREAIEPAQLEAQKHAIHLEAPAPVVGSWDRVRVAQVIANLLSNAQRYSPDGGEIRVSVEARRESAVLAVADHGIGIPPSQQRHLFEPGYRSKEAGRLVPGGAGLGLYITHEIVRRHGGRIEIESEPGRGSRFVVWLPRELPPTETSRR